MRLHPLATLLAAVLSVATARADILNTFNISGSGRGGIPDNGTLVIDTTTDLVSSLTLNSGGVLISEITGQGPFDGGYTIQFLNGYLTLLANDGNDDPASILQAGFAQTGPNNLYSGDITFLSTTDTTATPEPASLALLATGLLALPVALRRTLA